MSKQYTVGKYVRRNPSDSNSYILVPGTEVTVYTNEDEAKYQARELNKRYGAGTTRGQYMVVPKL